MLIQQSESLASVRSKINDAIVKANTPPIWDEVTSKPSQFSPSAHTHNLSDLAQSGATTGQSILWDGTRWIASDVAGSGAVSWGTITGEISAQLDLQAILDGKQAVGDYATGAQGALANTALQPGANIPWTDVSEKPTFATVATTGDYADLSGRPVLFDGTWPSLSQKPEVFPPANHGHEISDVSGLLDALDGKQVAGQYATAAQGGLAETALQPGASIPWADVTGKPVFAAVATTGVYADLSGLPALFDGTWASLSGKPALFSGAYGDLSGVPATFTPSAHGHAIGDVTGLQSALDGKQAAGSYASAAAGVPAGGTTGQVLIKTSSANYAATWQDVATWQGIPEPWTYIKLTDTVESSSAGRTDTALAFTPDPNSHYVIEGMLFVQTTVTSTGPRPGLGWPSAGVLQNSAIMTAPNSATTNAFRLWGAKSYAAAASGGLPAIDEGFHAEFRAQIVTGASVTGQFVVTLASETNGTTVRMMQNSWIRYRKIP